MTKSAEFAEDGIPQGFVASGAHTYKSRGVATVTRDLSAPPDTWLLVVRGEFDRDTLPCLRAALDDAYAADAERIALDLSGVTFGDSSFLNELLEAHGHPGQLVLVGPFTGQIRRLFELTGTDQVLALAADRADAGLARHPG
ncbi:STAS domain-containing protein [Streptomyces sp. R302]|uniref:STAS domain-containing protein n=1 Tax=unclassified Streptomyces TaxID=2593676 RepID=UPI00145F73EA|nr:MULTISPECIES: STAS domain-containing protein [unclassified Streptomyces]NML50843.1 STAS domain-containing protein [Streptomyces sp. R301]NML80937.1 STAS domain-containing protein [Streptomyces sp. R302]